MTSDASPAERFAASKNRVRTPQLQSFRSRLGFALDPFQIAACESVEQGNSVLVAAPTGAGKTLVAEFAIHLAMQHARDKVFYTAPMKALSNQKFQELVAEYGASEVGLLTGDTNVNSRARIVVMTTEVLRNMIYAGSEMLDDLRYVVLDEVHFLADRFRGAVWEEVIIHLPLDVRLVSLSATVSNAEEFGDWLQIVRGGTDVIVSEERPVPLDQHVLVGGKFLDLFDSSGQAATNRVNPELLRATSLSRKSGGSGRRGDGWSKRGPRGHVMAPIQHGQGRLDRWKIVEMLDDQNLLPAIFFVFSRVGCDQAVKQVLRSGIRLTTADQRQEIREIVEPLPVPEHREVLVTPVSCRRSRRSWRSSSRRSSSRSSSRPRPSPSASTCRRAPSCSRSSRSSTARRGSRSPRGSTPSSPVAPGGGASTSRATRSSSGSPGSTRRRWPPSPPVARTR
jgi:ATP-dependent RNA helicase HelY